MKNRIPKWMIAGLVIIFLTTTTNIYAQAGKRIFDGTIVYPDGSKRLPNGTIKYPANQNGNVTYPNNYPSNYPSNYPNYPSRGTRQTDGSIIYPSGKIVYADGTIRYPDGRLKYPNGRIVYPNSGNNNRWIPPGQAKKIYGRNARDYAPGHNRDHDRDDRKDKDWKHKNNDHNHDQER